MTFIKPIAAVAAFSIAALAFTAPAEARSRHNQRHHGHHHYHHGHGDFYGGAFAAGVVGLAAGAIIAGAAAQPRVVYQSSDWAAYCSAKFRSYDPSTNLYFGYDGQYHQCR